MVKSNNPTNVDLMRSFLADANAWVSSEPRDAPIRAVVAQLESYYRALEVSDKPDDIEIFDSACEILRREPGFLGRLAALGKLIKAHLEPVH